MPADALPIWAIVLITVLVCVILVLSIMAVVLFVTLARRANNTKRVNRLVLPEGALPRRTVNATVKKVWL